MKKLSLDEYLAIKKDALGSALFLNGITGFLVGLLVVSFMGVESLYLLMIVPVMVFINNSLDISLMGAQYGFEELKESDYLELQLLGALNWSASLGFSPASMVWMITGGPVLPILMIAAFIAVTTIAVALAHLDAFGKENLINKLKSE